MSKKLLTIDDSKAVRMIVKKAFKEFDLEIPEATNGVEGLAAASKENPDMILLDITMPVMDGIEMLTKLKADASLRHIPVIMLTAEAGKETVLKIAKIGIRDYIVKPFSEDTLIEKVGRVIDLRPISDQEETRKRLTDPLNILLVEDKPAIEEQFKTGFSYDNWKVNCVTSTGEAIDAAQESKQDIIVISLSLPRDQGIELFRILRSNPRNKYTPIFALIVKTDVHEQSRAQETGFTNIITKPIDFHEVETKIANAANLDTSEKYFASEGDYLKIMLPSNPTTHAINEVNSFLNDKISKAVDSGLKKVVVDVHELEVLNMNVIKLLLDAMKYCMDLTLKYYIIGNDKIEQECRAFEESKGWQIFKSIEDAISSD
jgi:two-component system cell cycle response regulator